MARCCSDLIGLRYRLGADGSDGTIDCIHLVTAALDRLGLQHPPITAEMYQASPRQIARWLLTWGDRVVVPSYDGDVLLLPAADKAFGVVWNGGILSIEQLSELVQWTPLSNCIACPCFRMKGS